MSRAPFVHGQGDERVCSRQADIYDTTIGWRFVNPLMKKQHGVDSMPETAENVAVDYKVSRAGSGRVRRWRASRRRARAQQDGTLAQEIVGVDNRAEERRSDSS